MAEGSRRFPPPWHADKIPGGELTNLDNAYQRRRGWQLFVRAVWPWRRRLAG
jgi:hypothetical protein